MPLLDIDQGLSFSGGGNCLLASFAYHPLSCPVPRLLLLPQFVYYSLFYMRMRERGAGVSPIPVP